VLDEQAVERFVARRELVASDQRQETRLQGTCRICLQWPTTTSAS
jgi:hypothetical protein